MNRFKDLKGNTFSSRKKENTSSRKKENTSLRKKEEHNYTDSNQNKYKEEKNPLNTFTVKQNNKSFNSKKEFPELPTSVSKEEFKEKIQWIKPKKTENKKDEFLINIENSKHWKGAKWTGPMIMRQKYSKDEKNNKTNMTKIQQTNASTFIVPSREIEYSRDGENWFNEWEKTFTEKQLDDMKKEEEKEMMEEWYNYLENLSNKYINESRMNYYETGELDFFAQAQQDRIDYERYAEQFEITVEENEEDIESDEYLDDDY
tara:strand:+ start:81 stop:860 length:780 start_codon:yes stop_codon:yes gene_type:complete